MPAAPPITIEKNAIIPTWFRVGGRADALATPHTLDELRGLLTRYETIRILGDGANLLVHDDGVDGLVLSLQHLNQVERIEDDLLRVGAGANLPKLITHSARQGLAGLEGLTGIPATLGGAVAMNAGGAFGEICQSVVAVRALTRDGEEVTLPRDQIDFSYRHSGLDQLIITTVDLRVRPCDPDAVRRRVKEVMAYKSRTQPMAEKSAGCVFKNPTLDAERISAGRLIDEAGCKGLAVGAAQVSDLHANFITTTPSARAVDILKLIDQVRDRVREHTGVELETELRIWRRGDNP